MTEEHPTSKAGARDGAALATSVASGTGTDQDAEIEAFFEHCPGSFAQQTPAWRNVIAPLGPDAPHFLVCRRAGEVVGVMPAYAFDGPLGRILTSVPQAGPLGGIACGWAAGAEAVYDALLEAYLALANSLDAVVATLITNPFHPDRALYEKRFRPDYDLENVTQVLDLEEDLDEGGMPARMSANLRRNLRKATSGGLRIDEDQSAENLEAWYAIHAERHAEIGATPLPRELFRGALAEMVPKNKARFFFVRRTAGRGEIVAGGFYVFHDQVIDALMPSTAKAYANLAPNFLLAAHTIRWARERGLRYYNWEPSPPAGGVYRFKRQWGSRDITYHYLTRVTGDAAPFLQSTPAEISRHYPWHFVLPFDKVGSAEGDAREGSSREAAWAARYGSER